MEKNDEDKANMHRKGTKATIKYQLNPSSQLLFEDALKKCLNKYGGSKVPLKSKYAPRNKHSPFGDFPASYMPKKNQDYKLIDIESHQVANSVSNFPGAKKGKGFQRTGAFSSLSKGTTDKPPKAGAFQPRKIPVSDFRLHYDRGDLPVLVKHERGTSIQWKDDKWEKFNYQLFLPIFVDGIREVTDPYRFIAIRGTFDILSHIGEDVVKVIPQLIIPLKIALNTRDVDIIAVTLKVIQRLVESSELAGEALVPYYRQLLPIFNLYRNYNCNLGDTFEYGQRKKNVLGDLIQETLEKMELNGGDDAFINIKYMIPTYESCVYDIRG
ncbi:MAG: parkin coregulated gene family protein [archaeon]|nr:parkin coregulated gene family protein [archaeon]